MLGDNAFAAVWAEAQALAPEQILSTIPSTAAFATLRDRLGSTVSDDIVSVSPTEWRVLYHVRGQPLLQDVPREYFLTNSNAQYGA